MITRITVALDRDLVRSLERLAQAENLSVSEFVGRELKVAVRRERSFRQARTRARGACERASTCAGLLHRHATTFIVASRSGGVLRFCQLDWNLHAVRKARGKNKLTIHRFDEFA